MKRNLHILGIVLVMLFPALCSATETLTLKKDNFHLVVDPAEASPVKLAVQTL